MTEPLPFSDTTPRLSLPLLHSAQVNKEVFVNEALAITDALLHCSIEGASDTPPPSAANGESWLVAAEATGEWAGRDNCLACRQSGAWLFIAPRDGMRVFDRSTGQENLFFGFWRKASTLVEPIGGSTVDVEARGSINQLIAAVRALGICPSL